VADYVTGGLPQGFHELSPERRQWIRQNIQKYAETHPGAWGGYGPGGLGPNPSVLSPKDLIAAIEQRHYQ